MDPPAAGQSDADRSDAEQSDSGGRAVAVAIGLDPRRAEELALVLTARGVPHAFREGRDPSLAIVVAPRYATRARRELSRYVDENHGWPPQDAPEIVLTKGIGAGFLGVLFFAAMYRVQSVHQGGVDWEGVGRLDGTAVRDGALERSLTALTLHSDVVHLVSNVVFGLPLLAGLCQPLGAGLGLLVALGAGGIGNLLSVLVHDSGYTALGASTAVFGALGGLLGHRVLGERGRRRSPAARFLPLAMGLGFLGLLGVGGERTDVVAHFTGFGSGFALGMATTFLPRRLVAHPGFQTGCGLLAGGLITAAWVIALARAA